MTLKAGRLAFKVTVTYVAVAGCWILFSDALLKMACPNPNTWVWLSILKGWFFVLATGGALFLTLRRWLNRWEMQRMSRWLLDAQRISKIGGWTINLKTGAAWLSPEAARIYGLSNGETLTLELIQTLPLPQFRPLLDTALRELIAGNRPYDVEFQIARAADGTIADIHSAAEYNADEAIVQGVIEDITERKQAQQAIQRQATFARHNPNPVLELSAAGEVIYFNAAANQMAAALGQKHPAEILPANITGIVRDCLTKARPTLRVETRVGERTISWSFFPMLDNQVVHGYAGDITERKQAETALRESESLLRSIMENSREIIFVKDRECRFVFMNPAGYQLTGLTPAELLGRSKADFHPNPAEVAQFMAADRRVMESGEMEIIEEAIGAADGSRHVFLTSKVARRDADGKVIGLIGIAHDITERKRAEDALAAERILLRTLIDVLPDSIYVKDTQGRFLLVNETAARRMCEAAPAELIGKTDLDFYPASVAAEFQLDELAVLNGQTLISKEEFVRRPDGTLEVVLTTKVPLKDGSGNIIGLVGSGRDITERKRVEQALRESQAFYHSLVMQLPVGIFRKDPAGRYVLINPAFCRIKNVKPEDFLGKTPQEVAASQVLNNDNGRPKMAAAESESHHLEIMETGKAIEMDEEYDSHDGRKYFLHVIKMPVLGPDGKIIGTQGIHFDITEQKRMMETIANERMLLRALVDHLPVAVYLKRPDGTKTMSNPMDLLNCGITSQADLLNKTDFDIFPADQAVGFFNDDQKVFQEGQAVFNREEKLTRPDGTTRWLLTSKVPLLNEAGRVVNLAGMSLDITERKRAEDDRARLATAADQAAESIVITDTRGAIVYVNPAFERVSGYMSAEVLGQNPRILKSGKQDKNFYRQMWEVLKSGKIWRGNLQNRRKDGTFFEEEATISPVRDAAGTVVNFAAVKRDVTREVQLEANFRQSQKMEAVGQLAGGVAHDFNNILAVIQLQAGLLKLEKGLSPQQSEYAGDIEKAAQRAADLIRQLLLFSRKQALRLCDIELNDAIHSFTKMLHRILGEQIQMQFKLANQPLLVHADASMLDQVLINLAVNARDAMPKGGQLIIETSAVEFDEETAKLSARSKAGSFVCLSVEDTGCGIPSDILPRIFEPFFTTKEVGKGSGLGLATIFGIVQQHKGWINVYSETGRGSIFRIYLPRLIKPAEKKTFSPTLDAMKGGTETILLVEDDSPLRANVRSVLKRLGYHVLEATHGKEALDIWQLHRDEIQLLLTDMVMPGGMTGIDLANALLKLDPHLKVIYSSGYSADVASNEFELKDGVNFLTKPFEAQKLAQTIRQRLDRDSLTT